MRSKRGERAIFGLVLTLGALAFAAVSGHAEPTPGAGVAPNIADAGADAAAPTHPPVTAPNYAFIAASGDQPIRVLPAAAPGPRALVYLHGYCGDINAVGAFVPAAAFLPRDRKTVARSITATAACGIAPTAHTSSTPTVRKII